MSISLILIFIAKTALLCPLMLSASTIDDEVLTNPKNVARYVLEQMWRFRDEHYFYINKKWIRRNEIKNFSVYILDDSADGCKKKAIGREAILLINQAIKNANEMSIETKIQAVVYAPCDDSIEYHILYENAWTQRCILYSSGEIECPAPISAPLRVKTRAQN